MKTYRHILLLAGALASAGLTAPAANLSPREQARIDALLAHVAEMRDSRFIRNGRAYDAASAATFLRKKLQAHGSSVTNASGFVVTIATRSSTTGQPYRIRFADGTETECGPYLARLLATLEKAQAVKASED